MESPSNPVSSQKIRHGLRFAEENLHNDTGESAPKRTRRRRRRTRSRKNTVVPVGDDATRSRPSSVEHSAVFLLQELSPFTNPKGIDTTSQASGSPFVASSRNYTPNPVKEVVALDCEMVGVGPGGQRSVLARVSIVSITGETVLDCYVKVNETITDFRTHVSGIRSEHLSGEGAFHFGTVRAMVQKILFKKVLVGHAVHNDLEVLNLRHPFWCTRDSATFHLFLKANGQPRRLRELAYTHLGLSIQEDGNGHCSVTDASACIDLYKLYQRNWDHWVQNIVSGSVSVYPPAYRFRH